MVLCVTNEEVRACLDMTATVAALERAYRADAAGDAVNIPRSDMILPMGADEAYVYKAMPGAIATDEVAAIRMQSDRIEWTADRKVKRGVARGGQYVEHVLVYDTETTEPILAMPDGFASKMRVGATNALGAKHMAPEGVRTVGLLGAGRQAGGQAWAFDTVFDLAEIRVFSPTRENREAFAAEWDERLDASVVAADGGREAVRGADVLACASNAMRPIFDPEWVDPGTHVSAIKNPEVPDEVFERVDHVAVHTRLHPNGPNNYAPRGSEFGRRLDDRWTLSGVDIEACDDLTDLVDRGIDREPEDTTLFLNNMGLGMQFAAVGRHVFERASADGVGEEIPTELFLQSVW
jgi:ornithine cyclodeaminase/alanine dehydrogenase-like protein (mu-crystallin family)